MGNILKGIPDVYNKITSSVAGCMLMHILKTLTKNSLIHYYCHSKLDPLLHVSLHHGQKERNSYIFPISLFLQWLDTVDSVGWVTGWSSGL